MANIRKLLTTEFAQYEAHLLRLGAEDRAMRFAAGVGETYICGHVRRIDPLRTVVLGQFEGGTLRAAAEIAGLEVGWPLQAELAVTVEKAWQDRGIGSELVRRVLVFACNRAIKRVHAVCLAGNIKMRRIVKRFEGDIVVEMGMAEGRIDLTWPTQFTVLEELAGDGFAALDQWLERLPAALSGPAPAV